MEVEQGFTVFFEQSFAIYGLLYFLNIIAIPVK